MEKLILEAYSNEYSYRLNVDGDNIEIIEIMTELIKLMLEQNQQLSKDYILNRLEKGLESNK